MVAEEAENDQFWYQLMGVGTEGETNTKKVSKNPKMGNRKPAHCSSSSSIGGYKLGHFGHSHSFQPTSPKIIPHSSYLNHETWSLILV